MCDVEHDSNHSGAEPGDGGAIPPGSSEYGGWLGEPLQDITDMMLEGYTTIIEPINAILTAAAEGLEGSIGAAMLSTPTGNAVLIVVGTLLSIAIIGRIAEAVR